MEAVQQVETNWAVGTFRPAQWPVRGRHDGAGFFLPPDASAVFSASARASAWAAPRGLEAAGGAAKGQCARGGCVPGCAVMCRQSCC